MPSGATVDRSDHLGLAQVTQRRPSAPAPAAGRRNGCTGGQRSPGASATRSKLLGTEAPRRYTLRRSTCFLQRPAISSTVTTVDLPGLTDHGPPGTTRRTIPTPIRNMAPELADLSDHQGRRRPHVTAGRRNQTPLTYTIRRHERRSRSDDGAIGGPLPTPGPSRRSRGASYTTCVAAGGATAHGGPTRLEPRTRSICRSGGGNRRRIDGLLARSAAHRHLCPTGQT